MCYSVPLTAAITTTILWKRKKTAKLWWLNLLFYGAALFGVIDHLWNGELFLVSKDWVKDIGLGIVITITIFIVWSIMIVLAKIVPSLSYYLNLKK